MQIHVSAYCACGPDDYSAGWPLTDGVTERRVIGVTVRAKTVGRTPVRFVQLAPSANLFDRFEFAMNSLSNATVLAFPAAIARFAASNENPSLAM